MLNLGIVVAVVAVGSGASDIEHSRLLEIVRERSTIRTGEFTITIKQILNKRDPANDGVERQEHIWFNADRSAYRLDKTASRGENGEEPRNSRHAFDGKSHKLIDWVGSPNAAMREYTRGFMQRNPPFLTPVTDPRLLGIYPAMYGMLSNYSLTDVERIATRISRSVRQELADGYTETYFRKLERDGKSHERNVEYQYSREGLPKSVVILGGGESNPIRIEMNEFYPPGATRATLPSFIEVKRHESGDLVLHEQLSIESAEVNKPIDPAVYSWKALGPVKGAPLMVDGERFDANNDPILLEWDGERFRPALPHSQHAAVKAAVAAKAITPAGGNSLMIWASYLVALACGLALVARLLFKGRGGNPTPAS